LSDICALFISQLVIIAECKSGDSPGQAEVYEHTETFRIWNACINTIYVYGIQFARLATLPLRLILGYLRE